MNPFLILCIFTTALCQQQDDHNDNISLQKQMVKMQEHFKAEIQQLKGNIGKLQAESEQLKGNIVKLEAERKYNLLIILCQYGIYY